MGNTIVKLWARESVDIARTGHAHEGDGGPDNVEARVDVARALADDGAQTRLPCLGGDLGVGEHRTVGRGGGVHSRSS